MVYLWVFHRAMINLSLMSFS